MGIRSIFAEAIPNIFDAAGEDATYTPVAGDPVACKIFIDFDVNLQPAGMDAQVWQQGTTIEVSLSTEDGIGIGLQEPNRGDVFTYDGTDYTVQAILANDGLTCKMVVT